MPFRHRVRDACATALMWAAYLLLVREALDGLWDLVNGRISSMDGARVVAVMPTLLEYGVVVAVNGVVLIGWALYNYFRFHGADRRKAIRPVTHEEVAGHFGVDAAVVRRIAQTRVCELHHHEDGRILRFDGAPPAPQAPTRETSAEAT